MTDIQRAMLGDHEAAARLTERGVLIPCPCCKGEAMVFMQDWWYGCKCKDVSCQEFDKTADYGNEYYAIKAWNTRAPLLTPEQIDMLERMESNEENPHSI